VTGLLHRQHRACSTGPVSRLLDCGLALAAATAVAVVLQPTSGQDSNPPICWNRLGAEVPCGGSAWPLVGLLVGVVVLALATVLRRRRAAVHRPPSEP
jgi:MYXO-CTERM domain-containing protein